MNAHRNAPVSPAQGTPEPGSLTPRRRGLAARLLRAISGTTGAYRASRRGSFLVLVVGTLALMSVFAVVYIAIGRTDTGAAVGVQRNAIRDNVPQQLADHIGGILSDDVFARTFAGDEPQPSATGDQMIRRETWDSATISPDDTIATFSPVGNGTDPFLASTMPAALAYTANGGDEYLQYKDLLQISNVAPDGRFVNLWNLRGNFDAESGLGSKNGKPRTSENLSLLDKNAKSTNSTDFGQAVDPSKPYYFTARQRAMFRPDTDRANRSPADKDFPPYQYASVDGSGMFDARWFELVVARDATKPDEVRNLLDAPSKYRYFFAAKVIDLSALVNVSTAGDLRQPPTAAEPLGLTPADVDLRRLFAAEDFTHQATPQAWKQTPDASYGGFVQPTDLVPPGLAKSPGNYEKYNDSSGANLVGSWAYTALQKALPEGYVPKSGASLGTTPFVFPDAKSRRDAFTAFAGFDSSVVAGGSSYRVGALFSADDLLDLFAYRGWNNPDITSTLERIAGGRYDATGAVNTNAFSVFRDNRTAELERDSRDINPADGKADPKAMLAMYANPRLYLTTISGARPLRSTIVGALIPSAVDQLTDLEIKVAANAGPEKTFRVYADALIPPTDDPALSTLPGRWFGESKFNNRRSENYGHSTAELGLQMAANMAVNLDKMLKFDGQPRAFTVLVDEDFRSELEQDWASKGGITGFRPKKISSRKYKQSWWVEKTGGVTGQLDLGQTNPADKDRSRLYHGGSKATFAAAFNVFGVHAEPVLTSVATMTMYTDASEGAPGADKDGKGDPDNGDPGEKVTINSALADANPDFLFQLIAFQLTNPYDDVSINLNPVSAATTDESTPYDYYFEYGQRYYRVGQVDRQDPKLLTNVTLAPGVTRVFFATNVSLETIAKRMQNAERVPGGTAYLRPIEDYRTYVRKWIDKQLTVSTHAGDPNWAPVWIEPFSTDLITSGPQALKNIKESKRFNGGSGTPGYQDNTFYNIVEAADSGTAADKTSVKVARLWRAMRSTKGTVLTDTGETARRPTDILPEQFLENDLLVDRIRDNFPITPTAAGTKPTLDSRLTGGNIQIPNTVGYAENASNRGDNSGFSLVRYGLIRRPADPDHGSIPKGAVPAYMLEARFFRTLNSLSPDYRQGGTATPLDQDFFKVTNGEDKKVKDGNYAADETLKRMLETQSGTGIGSGTGKGMVLPYNPFGKEPSKWDAETIQRKFLASGADLHGSRPMLPTQIDADRFRVADTLLPYALGPMQFIFDPANGNAPKEIDSRWMTTGEFLALSTGYDWLRATGGSPELKPFIPLYAEFAPQLMVGGLTPGKTDRGQLSLDAYVPYYSKTGATFPAQMPPFNAVAGDYRRGLGIPAALAVLDGFMAPEMAKYGSISKSIPGQINVATAPVPVLRTLPLLAPTLEAGAWWWTGHGVSLRSDIAASIAGYRDKVEVPFRVGSATTGAFPTLTADFLDSTGVKPDQPERLDGRYRVNDVEGIREQPGLHSIGEIGVARDVIDPNNANAHLYTKLNSIDYPGYLNGNDHLIGVDSQLYNNLATTASNTYAEKLQNLAAVSNIVTNRSDLFAVWFVVQGYQRSDVEGLDDNTPMVPSIQRRFFMVIDRSEVVKQGQKPRIVLMRELPM